MFLFYFHLDKVVQFVKADSEILCDSTTGALECPGLFQ